MIELGCALKPRKQIIIKYQFAISMIKLLTVLNVLIFYFFQALHLALQLIPSYLGIWDIFCASIIFRGKISISI